MIDENNKYTLMQKNSYEIGSDEMNLGNHSGHNANPDYWEILLGDILNNTDKWNNKSALDFGCGCGRNILNLNNSANWNTVAGIDISQNNLIHSRENFIKEFNSDKNLKLFLSNGVDMKEIENDIFDFVMSTIVLQHICVYNIRFNILSEMYRIMKKDGLLNIQMGYDSKPEELPENRFKGYYENYYDAVGTNSVCDCMVTDKNQIILDLEKIGFKNITYIIAPPFCDGHQNWIYVKAEK